MAGDRIQLSDSADPINVGLVEEGSTVYADWRQAGRRTLLDGIQTIRDNRLAKQLPWGEPTLEIPVVDLHFLKKTNPDLDSPDGEIKTKAWKRFASSPESLPYRVRGRGKFLGRSVGGI
jgi:hypothetical protein